MKRRRRVAVVASHHLRSTPDILSKVASFLVLMKEEGGELRVRANTHGVVASDVERGATALSLHLGVPWDLACPKGGGRAATYDRDYAIVRQVDRVIAFFDGSFLMTGGTGHVVQAALNKGVPVEAWAVDDFGGLVSVGSDEGYEVDEAGARMMRLRWIEWQTQQIEETIRKMAPTDSSWPMATAITTTGPILTSVSSATSTETFQYIKKMIENGRLTFDDGTITMLSSTSTSNP